MRRLLVALALLILGVAASFADDKYWRVRGDQARCLIGAIEKYEKAKSDPVIIMLKACPIVDVQEALQKLRQNSDLPAIKTMPSGTDDKFDEIIILNRAELPCIADLVLNNEQEEVLIPRFVICSK